MEQEFDNELMPTVGVYCTMACHDYEPPRLLSASESEVITPDDYPLPKEGTVGYVKVESKHYEGPELKPRLFDVDEYEFGVIYPAVLDELDPLDDGEVEIVDEPFDMSKVICST